MKLHGNAALSWSGRRRLARRVIVEGWTLSAADEAWRASDASRNVPEGNAYRVELLTTGSPEAVPVPENVFDGQRDRRMNVERVAQ